VRLNDTGRRCHYNALWFTCVVVVLNSFFYIYSVTVLECKSTKTNERQNADGSRR